MSSKKNSEAIRKAGADKAHGADVFYQRQAGLPGFFSELY
ncbi:hypothetical protein EPYR_02855 [Erwinia pyrifoliae DSM 12163]|nr:hypothetical protein EPYR_02855 [Erwinia pyrifoliae DSM 12163]